ncbi:DNA-directed RNA polymerase IV subunit 1 [Linum grandiflorum]
MEADTVEVEQPSRSALLTGITFGIATNDEKEKFSALEITTTGEVTDAKLGLPNTSSQCSTCGAKCLKSCEGHFGVIKFPYTILNPYFMSEIARILNNICPSCKSVRNLLPKKNDRRSTEKVPNACKYCAKQGRSLGWYPKMKFTIYRGAIYNRTTIMVGIPTPPTRKGVRKPLAPDFWDVIPKDEEEEENTIRPTKRILTHGQISHLLNGVDDSFIERFCLNKEYLFLNSFSVTPNPQRVTELVHSSSSSQRLAFDGRTRAYKKMVDFRGKTHELCYHVLEALGASKINPERIASTDTYALLQKKNNDVASNSSGLRWVKDVVLAKRNDHSFRMVVVGDPSLELSEIGIPRIVAERLQISEHLTTYNAEKLLICIEELLLEKGSIHVRRGNDLVRISRTKDLKIGDVIYRRLKDGDTVLINRPPSIHKHSLIALSTKILPIASSLAINPLCCSPFRGDFDGDCMHGYVPQCVKTKTELRELVALDKQLTNVQSGQNLLSLSQDSLTAAHLVLEDEVFLDKYQIQQLQMFCPRELLAPAIMSLPAGGVWTGKQLFSMLLPRGFDYEFPSDNVSIRDGEIIRCDGSFWLRDTEGNMFQRLAEHFSGDVLDVLYAAQRVFGEWLSTRGFSVSLSDFYLCPDSNSHRSMMDEILCGLQEAEETCNVRQLMVDSRQDFLTGDSEDNVGFEADGLFHERQRSAALSQGSVDAFKKVFRDIQNMAFRYASKNNSLLTMFKAGSKGNLQKLVQHSMSLGLQHCLVPLPFKMPRELSCESWDKQKTDDATEYGQRFVPSATVKSCYLTGLNPLEAFVHSVTSRDSSFSDNAELPGTLSRRLMFFMRDICTAYDGTVRNAYGNQLVQLEYRSDHVPDGGHPVGALAASSISEAAYSALDQPISLLEKSPLLNLKNVLECGAKKSKSPRTASLFLSEKLGRRRYGFEYGALEVQTHLQKVLLSDTVSIARIIHTPQANGKGQLNKNPWVIHFHLLKEILKKKGLQPAVIADTLSKQCSSNPKLPKMEFKYFDQCREGDNWDERRGNFCITVTLIESPKRPSTELETIQELLIPCLLGTPVRGFSEIDKVVILWSDKPKGKTAGKRKSGELYLRVTMSGLSDTSRLWGQLLGNCLPIMDMIDWTRSHPDNIRDLSSAYGIDSAWNVFVDSLESAIGDVGKTVLPQHLLLAADAMSITGEFVGLNGKGLKLQRQHASVTTPFVQAAFSNPGDNFIRAAKAGVTDPLMGSVDKLAWGRTANIGTGTFGFVWPRREYEISKGDNAYGFLAQHSTSQPVATTFEMPNSWTKRFEQCRTEMPFKLDGYASQARKANLAASLKTHVSYNDIMKLKHELRRLLNRQVNSPVDEELSERDNDKLMKALYFHPRKDEKIGEGAEHFKVMNHPKHEGSRCFSVVRSDGTVEDFSYHKCILAALDLIAPEKASSYQQRHLQRLSGNENGNGNDQTSDLVV